MGLNPTKLSDVQQCSLCILLGKSHVPSAGPVPAQVMLVGQSPGAQELIQGAPFVGPCGELIDLALDQAKLDRGDVYMANSLKCRPPGNRKAYQEELDVCYYNWLKRELRVVNPSLVVMFGRDAWTTITRKRGGDYMHLGLTETKKRNYLTCYHPGYVLRQGNPLDWVTQVGSRIREVLDNG